MDTKRDVREEVAEERRRLREMAEAEKAERRKKREEASAAAAAAAGGDGAGGSAEGGETGAAGAGDAAMAGPGAGEGGEEPSFELPEALREYGGDPDDKKAILVFRQAQQVGPGGCSCCCFSFTWLPRALLSTSFCGRGPSCPGYLPCLLAGTGQPRGASAGK